MSETLRRGDNLVRKTFAEIREKRLSRKVSAIRGILDGMEVWHESRPGIHAFGRGRFCPRSFFVLPVRPENEEKISPGII